MKRYLTPLVLLLLAMLFVAGCASNTSDTEDTSTNDSTDTTDSNDSSDESATDSESDDSRTLTIGLSLDMSSFDIHDHNSTSTEAIHGNMFNYLIKKDPDGNFYEDLVESYENVDDYTWAFKLKEGVTFHNGDELTSADVKFTLERVANDESLREYSHYRQIKEVEIIDDYHFNIITHDPEPILLNRLSRIGSGILPKNYIEEHGWEYFYENPIGTGPFKFVEWARDSHIVFEAYEDYFEGRVEDWDRLVFRVIPEDSTRVAELLTGGVDLAMSIPSQDWDRVNNNEGTSIASARSQRVAMLFLRHEDEYITSDPRIREAIDLAIDNRALTDHVLGGGAVPVRTRVTPGNTGANEDLYDTYLYDPERAKELLKEAGYEPGTADITFHAGIRYTKDRDLMEMIAAMLTEVGFNVNLDLMEWSNFVEMRNGLTYEDMYFIAFGNSQFDASLALDQLHSRRAVELQGYSNPEVDKLLDEANVNMNFEERTKQFQRVQEIIAEERPFIYLYNEMAHYGVSDRIEFTPRLDEMWYAIDIKRNY